MFDRWMIELSVKLSFLYLVLVTPLGVLIWSSWKRKARQERTAQNEREAKQYDARARHKLLSTATGLVFGLTGYYLLTRKVFDAFLLLCFVWIPPALLDIWSALKIRRIVNNL